jgi:hypothetical protein
MPEDLRYFENPYTGLLKEYHTGGLAVHFGAAAGPPAEASSTVALTRAQHELLDAS